MHRLLARQLDRFEGSAHRPPADWPGFLAAVEDAYRQDAQDRALLERSMELASEELLDRYRLLQKEMADRERMEAELRLAHKLEGIGQLAAGIAHEINTPVQYVGDSVHFLRSACEAVHRYVQTVDALLEESPGTRDRAGVAERLREARDEADLDYLWQRLPDAFTRVLEGIERVATIVRAVKDFSRPDRPEMEEADVNRAIRGALTVAQYEYKHLARIVTDLGPLPPLRCHVGQLTQVVVNLIVNAAHAIGEARRGVGTGTIRIRSQVDGDGVLIEVSDDGCGVPESIRDRIFEPFFTTKDVGEGSGQGLAIARNIVVDRHGGSLSFQSRVGQGTTFRIRLPLPDMGVAAA